MTTRLETSPSELWDAEYRRGGIPSSVREKPSRVLVEFLDGPFAGRPSGRALDIGCGGGRNTFFLSERGFETTGFDYSRSQVDVLQRRIAETSTPRVQILRHDVSEPWPLADNAIDVAADLFCCKHQVATAAIETYAAELTRCLAPGGRFLLFFATRNDGYYSQYPEREQFGPGLIITDPGNGIRSRLYAPEEAVALFPSLRPLHVAVKPGTNEMHGARYARESAVIYFEKPMGTQG